MSAIVYGKACVRSEGKVHSVGMTEGTERREYAGSALKRTIFLNRALLGMFDFVWHECWGGYQRGVYSGTTKGMKARTLHEESGRDPPLGGFLPGGALSMRSCACQGKYLAYYSVFAYGQTLTPPVADFAGTALPPSLPPSFPSSSHPLALVPPCTRRRPALSPTIKQAPVLKMLR
jgi:hypothetical protein